MEIKTKLAPMLIAQYIEHVKETDQFSGRSKKDRQQISIYGLVSEIGSVVSALKKRKLGGCNTKDITEDVLARYELREELGDVIWYCFALAALEENGDNDILTKQLETLSEKLKGNESKFISFRESLGEAKVKKFHEGVEAFPRKKQGTFGDFQTISCLTERTHGDNLVDTTSIKLMELAANLMYPLLPESEKQMCSHAQKHTTFEILGEITWYLAAIADVYGLSFDEIANYNVRKTRLRQPRNYVTPLHDKDCIESQQFPRKFKVQFLTVGEGQSRMYRNGTQLGHDLTDNYYKEDGYRFHDVLHFANMAHLGWSPVFRSFMGKKRKADPQVDVVEDGARARAVEEGILKAIHSEGMEIAEIKHPKLEPKVRPIFSEDVYIPFSIFKLIQRHVKGLEVEKNSFNEWKEAIRNGYEVYKNLAEHGQGTVDVDLTNRKITFCSKVYVDLVGIVTVAGIGSHTVSLSDFDENEQDAAWASLTEEEKELCRSDGDKRVKAARYSAAKHAILQALGNLPNPGHLAALNLTEMDEVGKFSVKIAKGSSLEKAMWDQKIVVFKTSFVLNQNSVYCTAIALSDPPKKKG